MTNKHGTSTENVYPNRNKSSLLLTLSQEKVGINEIKISLKVRVGKLLNQLSMVDIRLLQFSGQQCYGPGVLNLPSLGYGRSSAVTTIFESLFNVFNHFT